MLNVGFISSGLFNNTIINQAYVRIFVRIIAKLLLLVKIKYVKDKISIYSKTLKVMYDIFCRIKIVNIKIANKNVIAKVLASLIFLLLSIGINVSKASIIKLK